MSIDLGSKPEGATHINPHNGLWIKYLGGGGGHYQFFKDGQWEMGFGCMSNSYLEIAQPEPWNGEGLPPVGTVCEGHVKNGGDWGKYKIIATSNDYMIVFDEESGETPIRHIYWEFRPIRTAEQIAEEAREKAISKIIDDSMGRCDIPGAAYLYDAGYRCIVEAKQ